MNEWDAPDERPGEDRPRFVVSRPTGAGVIVKRVSAAVNDGRAERVKARVRPTASVRDE